MTLKVNNKAGKKVTWKSSNKNIATVNSSGKVTAKKIGTCTITATVGSQKLTCKLTVNNLYTDSKPHITGRLNGSTAVTKSTYTVTVTNKGNADIVFDGYGWIYPYGMDYNVMANTRSYGLPSTVTVGPGQTVTFTIYPKDPVAISSEAEYCAFATYKGKEYFFTIKRNGGGSYMEL